jgi:CDGSH-type Zn-finger protein/uncharacterized Fe-S cluster protein YjdI
MTPAEHRDQLVSMLAEAAEIEHCLMCTYLYAAFSLKQDADEDLQPGELAAVRRWKGEIVSIATDEMLHLALVNNLLIAIGARPHYRRFNFPIAAGLFPADVAVALAPFDQATLDHFIYLERPSTAEEQDAARYEKGHYQRAALVGRLMDSAEDYATVGELYETILRSFAGIAATLGEQALLLAPREAQLCAEDLRLPGLCTIGSVADAQAAVELIVHQGEGSRTPGERSHFERFRAIRREWQELATARPEFTPARAVARNPTMRVPVVSGERIQIIAEPAASLLDVGNVSYVMMLRLLALVGDAAQCGLERVEVVRQTLQLMHAVADIGSALGRFPANQAHPGVQAGLTFTVSRTALAYQSREAAALLIAERLELLAGRAQTLAATLPVLGRYSAQWLRDAATWRAAHAATRPGGAVSASAAARDTLPGSGITSRTPAAVAPPSSVSTVTTAIGSEVTIHFDTQRCIHSRNCVLGEPKVFLANTPGDWIFPDQATPAALAIVANNCPSGAIRLAGKDGRVLEGAPQVNVIRIRENGPLAVHADIQLALHTAENRSEFRATLCRCGQSRNKPYCDGSHLAMSFAASGEPPTRASDPLAVRDGPLAVMPLRDGPLELSGPLEICAGTGRTVERTTSVRLCRCGHSADKPFCDSTHRSIGFEAPGL